MKSNANVRRKIDAEFRLVAAIEWGSKEWRSFIFQKLSCCSVICAGPSSGRRTSLTCRWFGLSTGRWVNSIMTRSVKCASSENYLGHLSNPNRYFWVFLNPNNFIFLCITHSNRKPLLPIKSQKDIIIWIRLWYKVCYFLIRFPNSSSSSFFLIFFYLCWKVSWFERVWVIWMLYTCI